MINWSIVSTKWQFHHICKPIHFLLDLCSYLFCRCWSSFVLSPRRPVSGNLWEEIDEVHTRAPPTAAAARHKQQSAAGLVLAAQTWHLLHRQEETRALCAWNISRDENSRLNLVIIDKYFVFSYEWYSAIKWGGFILDNI